MLMGYDSDGVKKENRVRKGVVSSKEEKKKGGRGKKTALGDEAGRKETWGCIKCWKGPGWRVVGGDYKEGNARRVASQKKEQMK